MEQTPQEQNSFNFEVSPLKDAYILLAAKTPMELFNAYNEIDRTTKKTTGDWDYTNSDLLINKVKELLEPIALEYLTEEEKEWRQEILWLWYHHATSSALFVHKDIQKAKEFVAKALDYQSEGNPNGITKLLSLLANGRLGDAEIWANALPDSTDDQKMEKQSALDIVTEYEEEKI
jgi:hypothetical protein